MTRSRPGRIPALALSVLALSLDDRGPSAADLGPSSAAPAAAASSSEPLPAALVADPLGMPIVAPGGLSRWLSASEAAGEGVAPPAIETVARPLEEFVKTPWKAQAFAAPARPGLLVRQQGRLPFGVDAEWRVGVAVDAKGPGRGELADATQWTIRKAIADDFFIYLHDRGSGFMKTFGDRVSVYGRYFATGDKENPVSTVQFGAAKSY